MNIQNMTTQDLAALQDDIAQELIRRQTREDIEDRLEDVIQQGREAGVIVEHADDDDWIQPTHALNAYGPNAIVRHHGRRWQSTHPVNVHEPGVSGWRELVDEPEVAEYRAPTGAHDAYTKGDRVRWHGNTYEALLDVVSWSPSEYPAAWRRIGNEGATV